MILIPILLFSAAFGFFTIAIFKFPMYAIQFIIMMIFSGAFMSFAVYSLALPAPLETISYPSITTTNASGNVISITNAYNVTYTKPLPNNTTMQLGYYFLYLYWIVVIIFAMVGMILKMTKQVENIWWKR